MSIKSTAVAAATALMLWGGGAHAREPGDMFTLRGYGTAGLVYSDLDRADFVARALVQPEGAGYSDTVSAAVDSKTALQLDMTFTDRLSGVVQIISEGISNNSWDDDVNKRFNPSVEWANLSYRVTDDLTVRVGRIVLPALMASDYAKVGFANHWLRAPVEVYGSQPFTSSDGADLSYRSKLGGAINTMRAHWGKQELRTAGLGADVDVWGVNDSVDIGSLSLRAGYMGISFDTTEDTMGPLFAAFVQAAAPIPGAQAAVAEALRLQNIYDPHIGQRIDQYMIGASYDPGNWFVMSEVVKKDSDGVLADSTSGYVSGGYRWSQFTPYVTYSRTKSRIHSEPGIPTAGLPAPLAGLAGVIGSVISGIQHDQITSQQSVALGLRWNLNSSLALKTQYDYIDLGRDSLGMLSNQQPDFERGSDLNVFSIALDFVF